MANIEVRLELERADLEREVQAGGAEQGVEFKTEEPIEPRPDALAEARFIEAVGVVAVMSLAWLAKRLVDDWLRDRERGVQIDMRTNPPTVSRIAGTPRGYVVLIDRNGNATAQQATFQKSEDLLPTLAKAFA